MTSATLSVYDSSATVTTMGTVNLYAVGDAWTSGSGGSVLWYLAVGARLASYSTLPIGWATIDITSAVASESAGDDILSIKWESPSGSFTDMLSSPVGAYPPYITVTYYLPS